jgi:hypothetical protein
VLSAEQVDDLAAKLGASDMFTKARLRMNEGSAAELSAELDEFHNIQLPAATIRSWAARGKIEKLPGREYRLSDVVHCLFYGDLRASRYSMA